MPYSSESEVPSRIKGKKARRQWMQVWNSTYASTHDEGRAFAAANSVYNQRKNKTKKLEEATELLKFGTDLAGYTPAEYGPFKCATCSWSRSLGDEHICANSLVQEDDDTPRDSYGNVLIEPEACCNYWNPVNDED